MPAGRPRKPAALKILDGEKDKTRIYPEPDAMPEQFTNPPADLGEHGLAMWLDLAPKLGRLGITTELDRYGFEAMCRTWQAWRDDTSDMKKLARVQALLGEHGCTPASRSKVSGYTNRQAADPMERLLAGGL